MDSIHPELIAKVLRNEKGAQRELYVALSPKLYSVCLRYSQNRIDAQDLLQETFIRIFRYLHSFKSDGSIEAWSRRIAVNEALAFLKKKKNIVFDISDHINVVPDNSSVNVLSKLSNDDLLSLIGELPDGKKLVFNLYVIEGYSHKEIAEMLDISEGTSKSQLARAKELLVNMIQNVHNEGR